MSTPARIGKYEVLEEIGRGGFATVYKARDPLMRRLIAIKLCTDQDEDLRRRFLREARIAGSLDHPSIVRGFDCGFDEAGVYLVEEYLDGEDLKQKIRARSPIAYRTRLTILLEVAQAIAYAHSKGVYHRDIKPGNIRILDNGRVKIMDFGIAKMLSSDTPLTKAGTLLGTAGYVAPEQLLGKAVDHRVDIFAFGALAYEFLTYQRPFTGQTVTERLRSVLDTTPEPMRKFWADCPRGIEDAVGRCLQKDPASRYQSFVEVIADLQRVDEDMKSAEEEVTSTLVNEAPAAAEPELPPHQAVADVASRAASPAPPPPVEPAVEATVVVASAVGPVAGDVASSPPPPLPPPSPSPGSRAAAAGSQSVDQTLVAPVVPRRPAVAVAPPPAVAAGPPPAVAAGPPPAVAAGPPPAGGGRRARSWASAMAGIPRRWGIVFIAGVVGLGIAIALVSVFSRDRGTQSRAEVAVPSPATAPVAPAPSTSDSGAATQGQLIVSSSPWGELIRVNGADGRPVELPPGAATPLILTLPFGEYEVHVARPGEGGEPRSCRATVLASTTALCRIELARITALEYFKEAGWWQ